MPVKEPWLFGPKAVEKIRKLNSKFRSDLIMSRGEKNVGFSSYSPWLSLDLELPSTILSGESKCALDPTFLESLRESADKAEGSSLNETLRLGNLRIFSEVSEIYPDGAEVFQSSFCLMKSATEWLSSTAHELVDIVVPIRPKDEGKTTSRASFSSHDALGALFLSMPVDGVDKRISLALSFAHEIGHQVLMVYQRFDCIISSDLRALVYSGTRDTARPAIMSMHSAVALSYMLIACENIVKKGLEISDEEREISRRFYGDLRSRLEKNVRSLLSEVMFTDVGKKMIGEMAQLCQSEIAKGI